MKQRSLVPNSYIQVSGSVCLFGFSKIGRQNIIILFLKYLVDIKSVAWINLFWEHIDEKLFAVHGAALNGMLLKGQCHKIFCFWFFS